MQEGHGMASTWKAYNELAWTEDWLADPAGYEDEAGHYVARILQHSAETPRTLLHLGSGAGGMDGVFKRHFSVTGVDISQGMLARARARHPEIEYVEADIRSLRLGRTFDAVAIPDCIDYMVTSADLDAGFATAAEHLRPGGVLLVVGKTRETFRDNNFAYSGTRDGIQVTLFENNHVDARTPGRYEATLVYLVRAYGELTVQIDRHELGLFDQATWEGVFREHGLQLHQSSLDGIYDAYLLGDGAYPMQVFAGVKAAVRD
jgi:SAM-dependent methyltransferase